MIDPGSEEKVALVTGGNSPCGIRAAIGRALAAHGANVFIHGYRREFENPNTGVKQEPGLALFFEQLRKSAR